MHHLWVVLQAKDAALRVLNRHDRALPRASKRVKVPGAVRCAPEALQRQSQLQSRLVMTSRLASSAASIAATAGGRQLARKAKNASASSTVSNKTPTHLLAAGHIREP